MGKTWLAIPLVLASSLSAGAQASRDRNLARKRVPMDVTTASPSGKQGTARTSRSDQAALGGIERQTDRTMAQLSKKQTRPTVKFASDKESYSHEPGQAMPFQAQSAHLNNSGSGQGVSHGRKATVRKH